MPFKLEKQKRAGRREQQQTHISLISNALRRLRSLDTLSFQTLIRKWFALLKLSTGTGRRLNTLFIPHQINL